MRAYIRVVVTLLLTVLGSQTIAHHPPEALAQDSVPAQHTLFLPVVSNGGSSSPIIIPPTTEVLSEQTTNQLRSVSPDQSTFVFATTTPELLDVQPGDVMVGRDDALLPEGFLRKVVTVDSGGGRVTLTTVPAALEEAVDTGELHAHVRLTPDDIESSVMLPGVTLRPAERAEDLEFDFIQGFQDVPIYDKDGNLATKVDQVVVNGELRFTQEFTLDIATKWLTLQRFEFISRSTKSEEYEFLWRLATAQVAGEYLVARHRFAPMTFTIGPVPVVFTPVLDVVLGLDGNGHAGLKTGFRYETSVEAGLRYAGGQWQTIGDAGDDFFADPPTATVEASAEGYGGLKFDPRLYGASFFFIYARAYGLVEAKPLENPWLTLYVGFKVLVKAELEVLSKTLIDQEHTVIDLRLKLLELWRDGPPHTPSAPSPPDGATNRGVDTVLSWSGGDPDGDVVTYDVYLAANNPAPANPVCSGATTTYCDPPGSLQPNTHYYWQVLAEDSDGNTAVGPVWDFTTAVSGNAPPYAPSNPSPAHQSTDQNVNSQLGWSGGDPDGDPVTYAVYLEAGDNSPDVLSCPTVTSASCNPGPLAPDQTYYWQVMASDDHGHTTPGPVWRFRTRAAAEEPTTIEVALIIDSSGSMAWNDPSGLRREAAKVFVDAMVNGDMVAVVDFDDNTRVAYPLQAVTDDRTAVKAAINTINSSGGTNVGAGLQTGYNELAGSATPYPKAAVLLTDGQGGYNNQASLYRDRGWPVFTIGLSNEADERLLRAIANETGGQYFALTDPNQLIQVYFAIQSAISGSEVVVDTALTLSQGQTDRVPATLDAAQNAANFVVTWPGSRVDVTLIDPAGRVITPDTALTDPDVYHAKGPTYEVYRISYPLPGEWEVEVYGAELDPAGERVSVQVSQRDNEIGGGSWQEVGAGSASDGGVSATPADSNRPALAHTTGENLFIAWVEKRSQQSDIFARRWNGTAWVEAGAGSASGGGISNSSGVSDGLWLEGAPDGSVYLAWHEAVGAGYDIYVRRWNGSAWVEIGAGSASGGGISASAAASEWPSVGVAADGTVYVAWREVTPTDNEIYVKRWNGNAWVEVGAGSASGGGISNNSGDSGRPSLVIAPDGTPYVGWTDFSAGNTEVYVRSFNGSAWVEVGAGSASGGGISNNAGASRPPILAADSTGAIYAAWPDDSNGDFDIYVRRWNGTQWQEIGVGSATGDGISDTVEESIAPHVAIAPDDTVYVIWYEVMGTNTDIFIRQWTGQTWAEVGVGSASGGGVSNNFGASALPTVTITADNRPYIAWTDSTSGNYEIYIKRWTSN